MIHQYYYDAQIRSFVSQFCAIFYGLQVRTGVDSCGAPMMINVPCVMGSKDRVVGALFAGNTKNKNFSLPAMAVNIASIALANERRKAPSFVDEHVTMKAGGVFPDDLTVVKRAMPTPLDLTLELSIMASNQDQMYQILEQILLLFNPDIQIQTNESVFDWTRITTVTLTDITNEENYPSSQERRIISWSLNFAVPVWVSLPMAVKNDLVRKISVRIADTSKIPLQIVDENGELQPFGEPYMQFDITSRDPEGPQPIGPVPI